MTFAPPNTYGNTYLPVYRNYEADQNALPQLLARDYFTIAYSLNAKTNGVFEQIETQNGEQFFTEEDNQARKRYVFRKCYAFDAIAAGATLSILTEIQPLQEFTRIYGTCITDFPDKRPLPYVSATLITDQIAVRVDDATASIIITNGATAPNITSGIVVLEYTKNEE